MNKIEDTPRHRYALVDKTGKTRATCLGNGPKDRKGAAAAFKYLRGGRPIPKGWKVVDRGPVEPPKAVPTPAPAPRPFKVGDRVRGYRSIHQEWVEGTITKITLGDPVQTYELGFGCWVKQGTVTLLEPAPEPKAPASGPLAPLDPQAEKLLKEAQESLAAANRKEAEAVRILVKALDERDAALAEISDIDALYERRIKDCVASWMIETADNMDHQAALENQRALENGLPNPTSSSIVRASADRLRQMARNLFAEVKP